MPLGLPGLAAACFILGVLLYSTVVRAEYPDIGSNFFPAVLSVIMVFWIGLRMISKGAYYWYRREQEKTAIIPGNVKDE